MKTMLLGTVFTAIGLIATANAEAPAPVTATEAVAPAPAVSTADGLKSDANHAHPMQKGEESLSNDKNAVPAKKAKNTAKQGKKHASRSKISRKAADEATVKLNGSPYMAPAVMVPVVPAEVVIVEPATVPAA